jgi:steroid delta-isomerase-like uncharacterized protein
MYRRSAQASFVLPLVCSSKEDIMSTAINYVEKATAAFNTRDLDELLTLLSEDIHYKDPMGEMVGREATRGREQALYDAFPDIRVTMTPFVCTDTKLALTALLEGTFRNAFNMGGHVIAPNGKPFSFKFAAFFTFEGGYVVREEAFYDRAELMQKLGQDWE